MIYTSRSICKSNAFGHWSIPQRPGLRKQEGFFRLLLLFSFPLFIYTSYLNNSHCLLFSPNVPQKRPTMSYCSHQMDSWMQQVGQMARRPPSDAACFGAACLFLPGTLASSEHWVLCSLGVGWKWGTGKSFTCNTRGIINYQLPSCSLPPTPSNPPCFLPLLC